MWHKSNGETQRKNTARLTTSFWTATSFCAGFVTQLPPRGLGLLGSRVQAGTGLLGDSVRASMSEKCLMLMVCQQQGRVQTFCFRRENGKISKLLTYI